MEVSKNLCCWKSSGSAFALNTTTIKLRSPMVIGFGDLLNFITNMPFTLIHKCPNAESEWPWQFVFPSTTYIRDRDSGQTVKYHLHERVLQRAICDAEKESGIPNVSDRTYVSVSQHIFYSVAWIYSHSGATRTQGCEYNSDLYARNPEGRYRCSQPFRRFVKCQLSGIVIFRINAWFVEIAADLQKQVKYFTGYLSYLL